MRTPAPDPVEPARPAGSSPSAEPVGELKQIDVDAVVPNEFQPRRRFDEQALVALTDSVRELGVLQPILVRPDGSGLYELIAGERRWRAARRAGLPSIPAIVKSTEDQGSLEQAIVENLHREDLTAIEEAFAYQQLVDDFGLTQDEVAVRVGKSRSAVSNTLRLFQLPVAVQRLVSDGLLSAGHARALLGLESVTAQVELAERVLDEELSVRATEAAVRALADGGAGRARERGTGADSAGVGGDSGGRVRKSTGALEVELELEDRLSTKVEVVEAEGNGRIVIRFADADDLDRIYRLLL
jgi:ParB family chromosome partitioning protein